MTGLSRRRRPTRAIGARATRTRVPAAIASCAIGVAAAALSIAATPATAAGATVPSGSGYRVVTAAGQVFAFGSTNAGSAPTGLAHPVVGIASTPGFGYWLVASDGGVFAFGDAHFYGSTGGMRLVRPIVGMASTPSGRGYWLVASDGGVFSFGDAHFYGSTGGIRLVRPIAGMASTPSGHGYWLVASDGGVFSFGDADFYGSTGGIRLVRPIVGMASTPSGHGYWLVASDGGVFSFGDARFHGSTGAIALVSPIVGMGATPTGAGYWLAAADGGVFSFGDARFMGSAAGRGATASPVVGIGVQAALSPYVPRSTGYDISWPQCGSASPSPPHEIAIVGVNRGHTFSANPCFASEAAWAGSGITLYVNVDALPDDTTSGLTGVRRCTVADIACRSYNWGRAAAAYDLAQVSAAGVRSSMWWLDVEIGKRWRADPDANIAAIRGVLDGLRAPGNVVGLYSTSYQWGVITANHWVPALPLWVPGADTATEARQYCDPSHAFGGGVIWLTQWTLTYDHDYACPR